MEVDRRRRLLGQTDLGVGQGRPGTVKFGRVVDKCCRAHRDLPADDVEVVPDNSQFVDEYGNPRSGGVHQAMGLVELRVRLDLVACHVAQRASEEGNYPGDGDPPPEAIPPY